MITSTTLHPCRITSAKRSFVTRRVPSAALEKVDHTPAGLRAGDVVLAKVTELGQHQKLELPTGRRSAMKVGDEIVVACGPRYAPDQFHAALAEQVGNAHLVAAGGIAGVMLARHGNVKPATKISIIGRFVDHLDTPINLVDFALPTLKDKANIPIIAVFGTSMNAGKTTTCARLISTLRYAGMKPGYVKITGTGSGGDQWQAIDSGAEMALDFTDAGYATTYHANVDLIERRGLNLCAHAARGGCDVVVLEVADGLLQPETAKLLASKTLRAHLAGTVLAATDSIGAISAATSLMAAGHDIWAVTGAFTRSPLAQQEAQSQIAQRCCTLNELGQVHGLRNLVAQAAKAPSALRPHPLSTAA